jgi:hypothetical protein
MSMILIIIIIIVITSLNPVHTVNNYELNSCQLLEGGGIFHSPPFLSLRSRDPIWERISLIARDL